jgi:undecaprenyl-diphosphatase
MGDTALAGMLLVAVVILAHRRRWAAAVTVVIASLGGMMIDASLKSVFHRARPDYAVELITGPTWSFPSGHAMASIVGFGVLAYFRRELEKNPHRRVIISMTALLLIIAVGFSRLYLGVHYLTDVTGGFLVGGIWLIVCLEGYRLATRHYVPITTST